MSIKENAVVKGLIKKQFPLGTSRCVNTRYLNV